MVGRGGGKISGNRNVPDIGKQRPSYMSQNHLLKVAQGTKNKNKACRLEPSTLGLIPTIHGLLHQGKENPPLREQANIQQPHTKPVHPHVRQPRESRETNSQYNTSTPAIGDENENRRSGRSSNTIEDHHLSNESHNESYGERDEDMVILTGGKRKRLDKLAAKVAMTLGATGAVDPRHVEVHQNPTGNVNQDHENDISSPQSNAEATSKAKTQGQRGKYKSYVVDMKIKGKGSKLMVYIPEDIDRAIGDNARHLVNECGRVVRTRAPLDVKNWEEAFFVAGDIMLREILEKFTIMEGGCPVKLQEFIVDTMQRLYRLWKARLHYWYKKCGATDEERLENPPPDIAQDQWEFSIKRFGSPEFKKISERNSKNRRSDKRCKHTTGNLSFAEYEDTLTKQNNNEKPSADIIWLAEHTRKNDVGQLEWADQGHSKEIHGKLKDVIASKGDSMTQEEVLLEVLLPRSGYFRGKGTALRGSTKGRQQLQHQKVVQKQQEKIQEQERQLQEQQQGIKELEESQERSVRELREHKEEQQRAMDTLRAELLGRLGLN